MQNIVGQTPRNGDFFPRDPVVNKLYRRLQAGNNLFLSAPRRAGKTSIMRFLEDNPREGFLFLYVNVEDVNDGEEYFRLLSEELLKSEAIGRLAKLSEKAKSSLALFLERFKKIRVFNIEIETAQAEPPKYSAEFENLLRDLETEGTIICIMVDEFPVALEKIAAAKGVDEAVHFLHLNRAQRHRAKRGIRFIYTGSIGLPNVAQRFNATATINDLNIVEVPPLTMEEGRQMTARILDTYGIRMEPEVLDYLLERIEWLMPFFIQLVIQLVIDEAELGGSISKETIDSQLLKAASHRNNIYFENYYSRLDKTLPEAESTTAKEILARIALDWAVAPAEFQQPNAQPVLETLEFDGYIYLHAGFYRFNSPILKMWWKRFAA